MKVLVRIGVVFAVCVALTAVPASAICGLTNNRTFGSYSYYLGTTGGEAALLGTYWQLGSFATANSGALTPADWVNELPDTSVYLAGSWADSPLIVGCPTDAPAQPKMAFQISGPAAGGGTAYGAGCIGPDPSSGAYAFGGVSGNIVPMQPVPKVNVTGSTRAPGQVTVNIAPPNTPGGILDEGACGLGVQSYRVYSQTVGRNAPAPTNRVRSSGWLPQGGASPSSVTVPCVGNQDVYLAYTVVLNDGQEIQHVGQNSTVVQCGTTSSDQPTDFKIIKKPLRKPTSAQ